MANSLIIKRENFATVKKFFDVYPDIPTEPLAEAWCWGSGCGLCSDWDRTCDHPKSVSTDTFDMIQVIIWNIDNKILVDVYSYPGDNQAGYIYYNNKPVISIGDMDLEYIDEFQFKSITLCDFQTLRNSIFEI